MSINKNAYLRYQVLDKCFSNRYKRYFIKDLLEEVNKALEDFNGIGSKIEKRQLYEDIKFMRSEAGWAIPLEKCRDGKRIYYRYSDNKFSIKNQQISDEELNAINSALMVLFRFRGLPQFDWIDEVRVRIEEIVQINTKHKKIVSFDQNPYLKGLSSFASIFKSIQNQQVLNITYQGFKQQEPIVMIIHPWYLKQYNNRWFLFGWNDKYENMSTLALDRIQSISFNSKGFIVNTQIDFDEYFDDIIGVTAVDNAPIEIIKMKISNDLFPYINSKPIHGSQKVLNRTADFTLIQLKLQINYELKSLIFSYMNGIEVVEPKHLRNDISHKLHEMSINYGNAD